MVKNKKGKIIQMLSPENYIRKKARTLVIHECWINSNWEETQKVNIIIARKHTNGNFTVGFFLVDLLCLGVKDAYFKFNIFESEYKEILELANNGVDTKKTDYTLVHNIIFAGLEFADDYGFKPNKDYTSTMQYFLEDDTNDDIELMEIECGHNNEPLYVQGPYENETEVNRIIAQLEKTAGKGNYKFIRENSDNLHFDDDIWGNDIDLEEDAYDDEFDSLSPNEKIELFRMQLPTFEKMTPEEKRDFTDLSESIIESYLDREKADKLYDSFIDNLEDIEIVKEIPHTMLGIDINSEINAEEFRSQFSEIYELLFTDLKQADKKIKIFQKRIPGNPAVCFVELLLLSNKQSFRYKSRLKKYSNKFPNYPLIKLLTQINYLEVDGYTGQNFPFENIIESFFPGRKKLHSIEIFHLFVFLFFRARKLNNIEQLDVLDYLIEEVDFLESEIEMFTYLITTGKFAFILSLEISNQNLNDGVV
jgi:hypothetical protein